MADALLEAVRALVREEIGAQSVTAVDSVRMSLLGYPIEVTNTDVTIFDKRSPRVKLATVPGIPSARLFLRGYRREPSNVKAELVATPAKATTSSDKKGL